MHGHVFLLIVGWTDTTDRIELSPRRRLTPIVLVPDCFTSWRNDFEFHVFPCHPHLIARPGRHPPGMCPDSMPVVTI